LIVPALIDRAGWPHDRRTMSRAISRTLKRAAAPLLERSLDLPVAADLLNALPTPMVVLGPDDSVVMANAAAEAFFNTSQTSLRERGWAGLLPPDSPLIALLAEARGMAGGYAAYDVELSFVGGRTTRADVLVGPVADAEGWLTVSFQTRAVAQMVDRQMVHQGAARSAIGVAALLAHEIKNPLSGIRGAAQLLAQTADADGEELTDLICTEVDRIAKLVDRMEDFTDTRPLTRASENIHSILGHVRRVAMQGFAANIRIRERYDPSLPEVAGNRDALVQVFLNLVKNAAEAIGDTDGEIMLTTAYRHGLRVAVRGSARRISLPLEVCVIDTGPGASDELADFLFDPFVTSKRSGGGLGLALVAKIVGDHGGIIEYERTQAPPRTIFRVLLPMSDVR
jgi:two-component system, NtrC family, nitrogen regulation sensor histidine kinase GlnL